MIKPTVEQQQHKSIKTTTTMPTTMHVVLELEPFGELFSWLLSEFSDMVNPSNFSFIHNTLTVSPM